MSDLTQTVDRLRETRDELERRGIDDLAQALDQAIADLSAPSPPSPGELITTGEAARLLGIRSVNTIKRWAADGILEGYRRGARILVTRASVDAMQADSRLERHKARERALDEALAPFDVGDEPLPRSDVLWEGRKPWEQHDPGAERTSS
jgi:excisionase family DNA binding protein